MVHAVVPAAGRSRRMGRPKPLLPFGDTTVLGATLRALRSGGVDSIVVVVRADDTDLRAWCQRRSQATVTLADADGGMLASILAGWRSLDPGAVEVLLVCPADHPELAAETVRALIAAVGDDPRVVAVPVVGGRRGHPLALGRRRCGDLDSLDPEVGLKQMLERFPDHLVEVEVDDPGAIQDVDTPSQYRRSVDRL